MLEEKKSRWKQSQRDKFAYQILGDVNQKNLKTPKSQSTHFNIGSDQGGSKFIQETPPAKLANVQTTRNTALKNVKNIIKRELIQMHTYCPRYHLPNHQYHGTGCSKCSYMAIVEAHLNTHSCNAPPPRWFLRTPAGDTERLLKGPNNIAPPVTYFKKRMGKTRTCSLLVIL